MKRLKCFPTILMVLILLVSFQRSSAQNLKITGPFDGNSSNTKVTATGTGQTTGHIANLSVTNNGVTTLTSLPQTVFIPSSGGYQPYVAEIPGTSFPAGETTTIMVNGYCADVRTLPVPNGNSMPPVEKWIPVGNLIGIMPEGTGLLIPTKPAQPFTPEDIPSITSSPHFKPLIPQSDADSLITWPGTETPVRGGFNPSDDPSTFAPVIVKVYEEIKEAASQLQSEGQMITPFTPDSLKEIQAVIQQTFWIYTSALTGAKYDKTIFADKIYKQFQNNTGTMAGSLPKDQKENLDQGIDVFWDTFTAVGVEAKVLSKVESNKQ